MFEVCERCLVCYVLEDDRRFRIRDPASAARRIVHRRSGGDAAPGFRLLRGV